VCRKVWNVTHGSAAASRVGFNTRRQRFEAISSVPAVEPNTGPSSPPYESRRWASSRAVIPGESGTSRRPAPGGLPLSLRREAWPHLPSA
jgi:hypothetical protein